MIFNVNQFKCCHKSFIKNTKIHPTWLPIIYQKYLHTLEQEVKSVKKMKDGPEMEPGHRDMYFFDRGFVVL
jgi:hypothetical protein